MQQPVKLVDYTRLVEDGELLLDGIFAQARLDGRLIESLLNEVVVGGCVATGGYLGDP